MFLVFVLYAIFASSFWLTKECLNFADPLFLMFFRGCLAGLILLALYFLFDRDRYSLSKKDWVIIGLGSFCFGFLPNVLGAWALKNISSIKGAFYYSFAPFITAFVAYFFLNEKMTFKKWLGLLIGFAGVIPILCLEGSKQCDVGFLSFNIYDAAMILTVTCYAVGWIIIKPLVSKEEHSPFLINGLVMLGGGLCALAFSFFMPMPLPANMAGFLPWGMALVLANNIISYTLYMYLLKWYSPVLISLAGFSEYIFAIFYGWLFLNEQVGQSVFVSAVLICLGLYIFYHEELREEVAS